MNRTQCDRLEDLLVDYADGLLSQEQNRKLTQHLSQCDRCRRRFELLNRSLEVAQDIWRDAAVGTLDPSVGAGAPRTGGKRAAPRVALWAASVAALVLIAIGMVGSKASYERMHAKPAVEVARNSNRAAVTVLPQADGVDIEERIALEVRRARLMQSYEFLAGDPALEEYRKRAEKYLAEAFRTQQN